LVDANVLLDLFEDEPEWAIWSQRQLEWAASQYRLVINPVVYTEISIGFARLEDVDAELDNLAIDVEPIPRGALFLAGKAFRRYRSRRGTKTGVLPDFFIGAHAAVARIPLLTRDPRRYRTYFPSVSLIAPL
jgi:predicted nucleic acid-binding protein